MTDMDKLIAAVEAGTMHDGHVMRASIVVQWGGLVVAAFDGSLDAAIALHDALMPGWDYCIDYVQRVKPLAYVQDEGGPTFDGEADNPARSWLLAILKAVNARERKT